MEKTRQRESNIELLRNISMFMILMIHANFVSLPKIGYDELVSNMFPSVVRYIIESIGIVAVNVFVFISGWFGVRTRVKSVTSFIYQILFFLGGGGILFLLLGITPFSISGILDIFQLTAKDWFIKSYFVLMIISPILNSYCKIAEEKKQRYVMIAFLLFEATYCWVMGGRRFFVDGYGPLHFIGLYITAQYIHYHLNDETTPSVLKKLFLLPKWADLCLFFLCVLINTFLVVTSSLYWGSTESAHGLVYAYSNPITVIGALYLLCFFSKINMPYVKIINWLGASSFAVYLFHGEGTIRSHYFTPHVQYLYENYSGLTCISMVFLYLCVVFVVSVLIDQLRLFTWNRFWNMLTKGSGEA